MKIAAIVILYHPTENEVKNINSYLKFIETVYIYDNTEGKSNEEFLIKLDSKNYEYIKNNENLGLCVPLNDALERSQKMNYDFLLTMDQDSYFLEENFLKYINDIKNFKEKNKVGQFGLNYGSNSFNSIEKENFESVNTIITSASMVNLGAIKHKNIKFDENYFIDCLDFDFSFQIVLSGLLNIKFNHNYFVHKLGEPVYRASIKSLYLIKKKKQTHSAKRLYYMQRNTLYFYEKYKETSLSEIAKQIKKEMLSYLKTQIYYSENLFKAMKAIIDGKKDFKLKEFGVRKS